MRRPSRYQEVSSTAQPNPTGQVDLHGSLLGTSIMVLPLLIAIGSILRKDTEPPFYRNGLQLWNSYGKST